MKGYQGNEERGVPPGPNQIEVSVFGPGYGESILIHAMYDNWIIIDSCINPSTKRPAPLEYLEALGIDTASAVRKVIASHWHDDHTRGLAEIVEACVSAEFICSGAVNSKDFLTLAYAYSKHYLDFSTGIDEFRRIIDILSARNISPVFALANRILWKTTLNNGKEHACSIQCLSPSDHAILASHLKIARLLPITGEPKRCVMALTPNQAAVVLWISISNFNILLGSDLENSDNPDDGWTAIVNSAQRPNGIAECFKIPHHGSNSAHDQKVWDKMMDREHVSILAPFVRGRTILPDRDDVRRICGISRDSYATASIRNRRIKRDRTVEKTIKDIDIRVANPTFGQVRVRINEDGAPRINLFLDAKPLRDIYN